MRCNSSPFLDRKPIAGTMAVFFQNIAKNDEKCTQNDKNIGKETFL